MSGNAVSFRLLRDTLHARVSVSYVLEAKLLNDQFNGSPEGNTLVGSERDARFRGSKYITEVKSSSQCLFFSLAFPRKHDAWMQALRSGVIPTNCNQLPARVKHPYVLSIGPLGFHNLYLSAVSGPSHVFAA